MKKNLVVIGYGGMGGWHAEHALKSDVVNLLGVWDIKKERLDLAESRGIYAYSSLDEVLNDDRVYLCVSYSQRPACYSCKRSSPRRKTCNL